MKIGDLVYMRGSIRHDRRWRRSRSAPSADEIGIITCTDEENDSSFREPRTGVFWMGSDRIDYEPTGWLEVLSEAR
jgi:hypothetical protein